ncbi:hypothetical protein [Pantoea stewartii]|uniref:Uncharacterized protein n=1 Tax=Pantoea stewartii TaxID=66269 RepID=A0AB34VFA0_9GAMM|nr:hypothetical protein [Pantoea stewartii]KTS70496.1 hypothetical protein RSA30_21755 [Pantoea stewartii]KTS96476.1 hypothetical protein RSA13_12610 [Pantoea stewartii]KTT06385.1 hypothetical protein RSA36_17685 [Pantoea stewartii]
MNNIMRYSSVVISILFGAWLLSGAGIAFPGWFSAPEIVAKPLIVVIVLAAIIKTVLNLCDHLLADKKEN